MIGFIVSFITRSTFRPSKSSRKKKIHVSVKGMVFKIDQHIHVAVGCLLVSCKRAENAELPNAESADRFALIFEQTEYVTSRFHKSNLMQKKK